MLMPGLQWWKRMRGGGQCEEKPDSGAAALSIANVGGIFVVLLAGLAIACVTACAEYVWTGSRHNREKKVGRCTGLVYLHNIVLKTTL